MMLTSQPIKEGAAKKLGLVDDVVPKEKLLPAARQLALAIAAGKAPRSQTLYRTDKLESLGEALAIIDFAKAQAAKKGAHLTHPQLCLDAIRWGVEFGGLKGIDKVCNGLNLWVPAAVFNHYTVTVTLPMHGHNACGVSLCKHSLLPHIAMAL